MKKKLAELRKIKVFDLLFALTLIIVNFFLATEYHLGVLKAKLAKYRAQLLEPQGKSKEKGEGFDVMKSGDARVALIGFPSVGKVCYIFLLIFKLIFLLLSFMN